ncbi:phage head closure protein [Rummeliibacillus stabekisii]|uniref:phage head closure protein n=1 Tax=Rummeliibacillus stabekisii TaxID=241244 RepID=UPI00371E4AA1
MQPFKYSPNFNSGSFRHRITFLQEIVFTDELMQEKKKTEVFLKTWAMIKTVKGSEYFSAASTQNENTYRFVIRYQQGITPDMQIQFKEHIFNITSILNDDELDKTLTIIAEERVGNATKSTS